MARPNDSSDHVTEPMLPDRHGARAMTLDDDSLMMFEDALRAQLPNVDDIVRRANARKRKTISAAAIAIVAAWIGLFWLDPAYNSEQVATTVGERGTWQLSDGSEVSLNTDSILRVEYHLRSRRFYLPQGEALFKAQHSRWRSFIVYANHTKVEDIGTVFNVRNTASGARVAVLEGSVAVSPDGDPAITPHILNAGQLVEVYGGHIDEPRVDAGEAALWQNGKLHFDNTPLSSVVDELRRYRRTPIRLAPSLSGLRITGQFDIDRIDQLLALLPTLAPVAVNRNAHGGVDFVAQAEGKMAAAAF